jgi:hypothetical protein
VLAEPRWISPESAADPAEFAKLLELLPESGRDPRRFANCSGSLPESGRYRTQFGRSPARCCEGRAVCGESRA